MKIHTTKEKLELALLATEQALSKGGQLPVLKCLKFSVGAGTLKIESTNLDLAVQTEIPVRVLEKGEVVVPGTLLRSFVSNLHTSALSLETSSGNLVISGRQNTTTIKAVPPDDFPKIPEVENERGFIVDRVSLAQALRSVWYSAAVSSVKPELSSVLLSEVDNELLLAATDSFRLAEKKIKIKKPRSFGNLLLPLKNVSEIVKILEIAPGDAEVLASANQILIKTDSTQTVSRVIEGVFPDYKQIIPTNSKTEAVLLKQDFANALKTTMVFSGKLNQIHFEITPKNKKFKLSANNIDIGDSTNQLEATLNGDDLSINFNHKYIYDCLQSIGSDSISIEFAGLGKPAVIRGVSDNSFLYVVMPMNK